MRPEYNVKLDREKLAFHGLNSATVSSYIRNRINGYTATKYREDGDEYDVIVRFDEKFRTSLENIENILVYNSRGDAVRVGDLCTVIEEYAPPAITRENRQRVVTVTSSLGDGVALGTVIAGISTFMADYDLPEDVYVDIGGSYEDQQESFGDMGILLLLIILLVYIVMATQFESFLYPLIIMITIFLAFPGVFFALWISGTSLSLMALIGAIMLVGIVVKNGIVMVDYTNLLRERGHTISQAVVAAGKSRMRPVLMTSMTTILGMLPMALGIGEGSELWQPMGVAIIGGLVFSTFLTLLVVPVMYSLFGGAGVKRQRRRMRDMNEERDEQNAQIKA
jgi:HAE1 family hydrophobic/amphiphilic exporter-1